MESGSRNLPRCIMLSLACNFPSQFPYARRFLQCDRSRCIESGSTTFCRRYAVIDKKTQISSIAQACRPPFTFEHCRKVFNSDTRIP
jgi:hypothetical protein